MRLFKRLLRELFPKQFKKFKNSHQYWNNRYDYGGNSGKGSRDSNASSKATFFNQLIKQYGLKFAIELGSGDGENAYLYHIEKYIGYDISPTAVSVATKRNKTRNNVQFFHEKDPFFHAKSTIQSKYDPEESIAISFDVLFHLVEDAVYKQYLYDLTQGDHYYILIYSTNFDQITQEAHIKHRRFSEDVCSFGWSIVQRMKTDNSRKEFVLFRRNL